MAKTPFLPSIPRLNLHNRQYYPKISFQPEIYGRNSGLANPPSQKMPACVLRLSNDSPFRTALIDEATRRVRYRIHTPIRVTGSFTRIKKFEPRGHPSPRTNRDVHPNFDGGIPYGTELEGYEANQASPEIGEEAARICWKWFEQDEITFQGRRTSWHALLPSCGKLGR